MKISFKTGILWASLLVSLSMAGCGGLPSDALNIELEAEDTSNWWSGNQISTVVRVRSTVAEDITIQNVTINNGGCTYSDRYNQATKFPVTLKMGQFIRLQIRNCGYNDVIQVDVETDKGSGSYKF